MGKAAFSLLEILIVVAIIIILAGALTPLLSGSRADARTAKASSDLDSIKVGANMCHADTGEWPDESSDGEEIIADTAPVLVGWNGPYLDEWRVDPWGEVYQVKDPPAGNARYVVSGGPDGIILAIAPFDGSDDDIYYQLTPDHTQ